MIIGLRRRMLIPAVLGVAVLLMVGCAGQDEVRREPPPEPPQPGEGADTTDVSGVNVPGVGPAVGREATRSARHVMVGARADSLSEIYFEQAEKAREEGHPLAELWRKGLEEPETPPAPEDTMRAFDITLEADASLRAVADILGEEVYVLSRRELQEISPQLRQRAADRLEEARDLLQQALTYNPWDSWSRVRLIETLEDLAKLHQSLDNMERAIEHTEVLLQANRSDYLTALHLADRYLMLGDSLNALRTYRHSEDLLHTWAPLNVQYNSDEPVRRRTTLDSLEYYDWLILVREQMFLEQDLKMGNDLIVDANRLKAMARPNVPSDSNFARTAEDMLNWIGWDEGNIYTASARIPIIQMINEGNHEDARELIRKIRPELVAPMAKLEMDTLAAVLDFGYLDRPEAGIERLRNMLVEAGYTEIDSSLDTLLVRLNPNGFASRMVEQRDELPDRLERVLELYGTFTTSYANKLEKQDRTREKAFVYYYQSSLLPHRDQAFALLALSNMSTQDPERTVRYGEAALADNLPSTLSPTDRRLIYELLVTAYRNLNDLNRAEHYFRLLEETG